MSKTKTTTKTVETATATENITVKNKTVENFENLYNALCKCETKHQLVDTMFSFGFRTTTKPTDTKNTNDLYIQFFDKSRVLITKKSLKLYTCDSIATDEYFNEYTFDTVCDGSYRTNRATVANTLENFTKMFSYFATDNNNRLPQPQVTA